MTRTRALRLAVEALEYKRGVYAPGFNALRNGLNEPWARNDADKYEEINEAIEKLEEE